MQESRKSFIRDGSIYDLFQIGRKYSRLKEEQAKQVDHLLLLNGVSPEKTQAMIDEILQIFYPK